MKRFNPAFRAKGITHFSSKQLNFASSLFISPGAIVSKEAFSLSIVRICCSVIVERVIALVVFQEIEVTPATGFAWSSFQVIKRIAVIIKSFFIGIPATGRSLAVPDNACQIKKNQYDLNIAASLPRTVNSLPSIGLYAEFFGRSFIESEVF